MAPSSVFILTTRFCSGLGILFCEVANARENPKEETEEKMIFGRGDEADHRKGNKNESNFT